MDHYTVTINVLAYDAQSAIRIASKMLAAHPRLATVEEVKLAAAPMAESS